MLTWSRYVLDRIGRNDSFNCAITGKTGSGKSYASLSWAEELSNAQGQEFSVDRLAFDAKEFMEIVSKPLPPGSVIVLDEAGLLAPSAAHMSTVNQALSLFFQTTRFRRWIFLLNCPNLAMFDINVRRLLHAHGTTKGVNHRKKVSRVALMTWETDQVSGKVYRKWLRRRLVDKREVPLRVCEFKMPSKELIDAYERKKKLHLDALNVRLKAKIDAEDEKAYGKLERKPLVLTKRQTEFLEVIQNNNFEQASAIMGVSSARLSHIKLALEERGYGFRAKRLGLNQTLGYEVIPPPTKRVV